MDIEKLVQDNIVDGTSLLLENRQIGDAGVLKLAEMQCMENLATLELGENDITNAGVEALCQSPYFMKLKTPMCTGHLTHLQKAQPLNLSVPGNR